MIVAGHQPNYLPWLGFFDKINKCDIFIIEDNLQFVYHEFQNRNRIKTPNGIKWLTVPVKKGRSRIAINEVKIDNTRDWRKRHWMTLHSSYARAPYWEKYNNFFRETYSTSWSKLIDLNTHLIQGIMRFLGIEKRFVLASSLETMGQKNDLLISQVKKLEANKLLSGIGAQAYMDIEKFRKEGIEVIFQEFTYPVYKQLWGNYIPNLSVVDYLFCTGNQPRRKEL